MSKFLKLIAMLASYSVIVQGAYMVHEGLAIMSIGVILVVEIRPLQVS